MEHATVLPVEGEIVMPESVEQCKLLYEPGELIPLGDFGRSAGYGVPVLVTPEAARRLIGFAPEKSARELADRLIESLASIREAATDRQALDAFVVDHGEGDDRARLLVRQNLLSSDPYALISLDE